MAGRFKALVQKMQSEADSGGTVDLSNPAATINVASRRKSFWDSFANAMTPGGGPMKMKETNEGTAEDGDKKGIRKVVVKLQKDLDKSHTTTDREEVERFEDILELRHLRKLRELFMRHRPEEGEGGSRTVARVPGLPKRRNQKHRRLAGNLNADELKEYVSEVMGSELFSEQLDRLFSKLDTSCDGLVDWGEFCTYLLLYLRENDLLSRKREMMFVNLPKVRHIPYNKQGPTARILFTENPVKIVNVGKNGCLSVWTASGIFENSATCHSDQSDSWRPGKVQKFNMWAMDSVYMHNCHKVSVATSGRDLRFFEYGSGAIKEEVVLYGFPDVIQTMDYHYQKDDPNESSSLYMGDEAGSISVLTFFKPTQQLFDLPINSEKLEKVWLPELELHKRLAKIVTFPHVHSDAILSLRYIPENECTISCCRSAEDSLLMFDVQRNHRLYTFSVRRGVECFHLHRALNILVTGSHDHLIRLWNPYVNNRPTAALEGHQAPVLSVHIMEKYSSIVSFSRDCVIKVWDVKEHQCLQTIQMRLTGYNPNKLPEFLYSPFHLSEASNMAICAASDYMVMYKLGKPPEPLSAAIKTHQAPLCGVIYNPTFKQVVTGSDNGVISTWDIATGSKCLMLPNAHNGDEITALAFDESHRKLISGSRNGSINVWNLQNGHNLHHLVSAAEAEITALYWSTDKNIIYATGWSRQIVKYDTSRSQIHNLHPDTSWKSGIVHDEDILCADICPPYFLVTGSYDGELILWSLDTEVVLRRLRPGRQEPVSKSVSRIQGLPVSSSTSSARNSRPNSRHRQTHKTPAKGMPIPVDGIRFLKHRLQHLKASGALMITSDAGTINWWKIYGTPLHCGYFYAASQPDESVLGMCTSTTDSVLVTADSAGCVLLWDISHHCLRESQIPQWKTKPPLLRQWKAHDAAIVGIEMMNHDTGRYVVTASTDHTAKMFSIIGECVGTYGQKEPWNLSYRKSWVEYKDMYYLDEEDLQGEAESRSSARSSDDEDASSKKAFITRFSKENTSATVASELGPLDEQIVEETDGGDSASVMEAAPPEMQKSSSSLFRVSRSKTILGEKAEKNLERIRESRQSRRHNYGDVDVHKTLRFGDKCSPFAALSTMDLENPMVRSNLATPGMRRSSKDPLDGAQFTTETIQLDPFLQNLNLVQAGKTGATGHHKSDSRHRDAPHHHQQQREGSEMVSGGSSSADHDGSVKLPRIPGATQRNK